MCAGPPAPAPSVNDVPGISVAHFKRTERLNDRVGEQSVYEPMAVYSNVFRGGARFTPVNKLDNRENVTYVETYQEFYSIKSTNTHCAELLLIHLSLSLSLAIYHLSISLSLSLSLSLPLSSLSLSLSL